MKPTFISRLLLSLLIFTVVTDASERLLKVPRIYNALITSNEELLPSQAYPAVAPVIQPSASSIYFPTQSIEYRESGPENISPRSPAPTSPPDIHVLPTNIKNYQPINSAIPDVPPPPLPMRVGLRRIARSELRTFPF